MLNVFTKPIRRFLPAFCLFLFFPTSLLHSQNPVVYPLHVSDYWEYNNGFISKIVKDTLMSNGKTYAKMVSTGIWPKSFQRYSNDSVFYYWNNQDALFYDFSSSSGDTFSTIITGSDTLDISLISTNTVNIFGRERQQWKFYLDLRNTIDEEEYHWITDSLGLTKWADFFFSYELQGAIINGDTFGVVTSIEEEQILTPEEFRLYQNYPNPFNASTHIRFTIPKSAFVSLKIYNVLGHEVATLVSERLIAGSYIHNWDAGRLSSGIYYYHLVAGDFKEVKKMVLMK